MGWDSSVGIATRYGLDGGGDVDHTRSDRPWGPSSLPNKGYRVSSPGVRRPGRGVNHPSQSSDEVEERVELHIYITYGSLRPVLGRTYTFTFSPFFFFF
jgi:hypothetical protein